MKRRILSMLLVVCMVISMLATAAFAAPTYVDTEGHWGEEAIEYWSGEGVVGGVGEGRFNPDGLLTRAEAAAILARLLKLTNEADISKYTDCVAGEWYYAPIAKCVAAGILGGTSETTMEPGAYLSRAQMFTMFCRATGIAGESTIGKYFVDYSDTPVWAVESVNALVNQGYVGGTSATTLEPNAIMTRASLVVMLRKAIAAYVTEGGKVEVNTNGIVLIVTNKPTQIAYTSVVTNTGAVVATQANSNVQVSGNFSGTVVANQANTTVSLSGQTGGTVEVVANADNVNVINAPAGTTVTSNNGSQNVTVNGTKVETNDSETVVTPTTPVVPPSGGHTHSYTATVTTPATCTTAGVMTYRCICGAAYNVTIPATGAHQYGAPTFTWADDNSCTATYTCAAGGETVENVACTVTSASTDATCTTAGTVVYTAKITVGGKDYTDTKTVTGVALGHTYGEAEFVWADDYTATATKTCTVCDKGTEGRVLTGTVTVTSEVTTKPGCKTTGVRTYTATATFSDDTTASETKEEVLAAVHTDENEDGICDICVKFYLGITAVETADITVYDDYSAEIVLPAGDLNPSSVSLTAIMQNVASLGAAGQTKSETFTLNNTGLTGSPSLYDWLIEAWEFESGKIVATIDGKAVTYTLTGNGDPAVKEDVTITATAATKDARDAWKALTANITTTTQDTDNSYIVLKNGSYMQIGGDKLVVGDVTDDLTLNNLNNMDGLKQAIKDGVKVETDIGSDEIEIKLAKDTALAVGQSVATLNKDATIKVGGLNEDAKESLDNVLENMRALGNQGDYMGASKILIGILGDVIAAADGGEITVDITFSEPVVPPVAPTEKFYLGITAAETASMTVMSDYSATIVLPAGNLNPSSVSLTARMTDVASLGCAGQTKSETFTLNNTGLTGSPSLYTWLDEAWAFESGKIVANIGNEQVTYTLTGNGKTQGNKDVTITATADTEAARAAWKALTANITTTNQDVANSYILLKNGSYLQIGGDKLVVGDVTDDLTLNNLNNMAGLKQAIKDGVKVVAAEDNSIVIGLKKDTVLAVGQSVATLTKDATIQIDLSQLDAVKREEVLDSLDNVLELMRALGNQEDYMGAAKILIGILGDIITAADGSTVVVNITFA